MTALIALWQREWAAAEALAGEVVARDHHDLFAQRVIDAAREQTSELRSAADRWLADRTCPAPFEQIETRTDGAVHFCCSGWQPVPIGNIADGSAEMWNSARARESAGRCSTATSPTAAAGIARRSRRAACRGAARPPAAPAPSAGRSASTPPGSTRCRAA